MASIYERADSPKLWIRYKTRDGRWKAKATRYRKDNIGDRRQAALLAREKSDIEAVETGRPHQAFTEWVPAWLETRYGGLTTTTPDRYRRLWRNLSRYLTTVELPTPAHIRREFIGAYFAHRQKTVSRNTAISEIKFLAMVMDEAVSREMVDRNPLRRAGLKKAPTKGKAVWSPEQIRAVHAHLTATNAPAWMIATFTLGLYQACRLRQCALPVTAFRFDLNLIRYPAELVKGQNGYAHEIDRRALPILQRLVADAKAAGAPTICELPWDPSIQWRRFLDTIETPNCHALSHHGLRKTWITMAADAGIAESAAMAFCHHESREVHRIYKELSSVSTSQISERLPLPDFSAASVAE